MEEERRAIFCCNKLQPQIKFRQTHTKATTQETEAENVLKNIMCTVIFIYSMKPCKQWKI
jgi:hypothetical protein